MALEHIDVILSFVLIIAGVSLIITALNQAISALLGLRGSHLRWGLETLLSNIDPSLKDQARKISEEILKHPMISDSTFSGFSSRLTNRWRLATAIDKDELTGIIKLLAHSGEEDWQKALRERVSDRNVALDEALLKAFPGAGDVVDRYRRALANSATDLSGRIAGWFDTVMSRTSQRFALQMRVWTVVFAIMLAFGLQLDALKLFTRLSSDAELRMRIMASADALNEKADELHVLETKEDLSARYLSAMKQFVSTHTNISKGGQPSGFNTLEGAQGWLRTQLQASGITNALAQDEWIQRYDAQIVRAPLLEASDELKSLLSDKLLSTIVPSPYPDPFYRDWSPGGATFWGIAASAALLSLGAPFWFNVLRTLSNLRPIVAQQQDAEKRKGNDH